MGVERLTAVFDDARGSSPTVGAVLLAGITVLMATTAGSQMISLAESPSPAFATANAEFDTTNDRVKVTWIANGDADYLEVQIFVGDQSRTIKLKSVGDMVIADSAGVTISNGAVGEWGTPTVNDGDEVTVIVRAIKGSEGTTIIERTDRV